MKHVISSILADSALLIGLAFATGPVPVRPRNLPPRPPRTRRHRHHATVAEVQTRIRPVHGTGLLPGRPHAKVRVPPRMPESLWLSFFVLCERDRWTDPPVEPMSFEALTEEGKKSELPRSHDRYTFRPSIRYDDLAHHALAPALEALGRPWANMHDWNAFGNAKSSLNFWQQTPHAIIERGVNRFFETVDPSDPRRQALDLRDFAPTDPAPAR